MGWLEKARKLPEIADSALEQVSKLEEYQTASEERHNELMGRLHNQVRLTLILILIFIFMVIFLIIK